eukprot:COSAG01_NODE_10327_length_2192_cov_5.359771_2_plen_109_part_00
MDKLMVAQKHHRTLASSRFAEQSSRLSWALGAASATCSSFSLPAHLCTNRYPSETTHLPAFVKHDSQLSKEALAVAPDKPNTHAADRRNGSAQKPHGCSSRHVRTTAS